MPTLRELNKQEKTTIYDLEPDMVDANGKVISWRKKAQMASREFGQSDDTDLPIGKLKGSYPTGKGRGMGI